MPIVYKKRFLNVKDISIMEISSINVLKIKNKKTLHYIRKELLRHYFCFLSACTFSKKGEIFPLYKLKSLWINKSKTPMLTIKQCALICLFSWF